MFEALASWDANAPAVWMSTLGGTLLEVGVGVGVGVGVRVLEDVVPVELEGLALVLEDVALLLLLGVGDTLALGLGDGEGDEFPLPKLHDPWRTPKASKPKKSNNPWEKSRLLYPHPMHSSTIMA